MAELMQTCMSFTAMKYEVHDIYEKIFLGITTKIISNQHESLYLREQP